MDHGVELARLLRGAMTGIAWAALFIWGAEFIVLRALDRKYMREGEDYLSPEEFLSRASLDDILRYRHHVISSWIAFGTVTICAVMRVIR